jgi:hypothetical protein
VSAGAVVLLHAGLLAAFLVAEFARTHLPAVSNEIVLTFPARSREQPPPAPMLRPTLITPALPRAIAPPVFPIVPPPVTSAPGAGSISGLGRALFGCDPMKLDRLSPEARAACLRLAPGKSHEQSVRLGPPPDPDSPFTKEIEERFRKAQPISRPCPLGSYNDIRGLPCFGFDQEAPLLRGH